MLTNWFRKNNNRQNKERNFDPSPKMKVEGEVYITKIVMIRSSKLEDKMDPIEHLIFSGRPVDNDEILSLEDVITFRRKYKNAEITKEEYHCDLKTVRVFDIDLSDPVQPEC